MSVSAIPYPLEVAFEIQSRFGLAHEQNAIPLVQGIQLYNRGTEILEDWSLELHLTPDFGEPQVFPLPSLAPGERLETEHMDFALPAGALRQLDEAERGTLLWSVRRSEERLAGGQFPVEVLPSNHWPGSPPLLAAFVLPNHPAVGQVLRRTRETLNGLTGNPSLEGYQANQPERVAAMARALYETLQGFDLTYLDAPASFESVGQKIRLPDAVFSDRLGCCLDIATLIGGCLEAMGLAPLLILVKGHAYQGVWLSPGDFPEGVIEHAARLRNEIALGRLLVFDSSAMVHAPRLPFERAIEIANENLLDDEGFRYALDVRVARRASIRPLSTRSGGADEGQSDADDLGALTQAPTVVVVGGGAPDAAADTIPSEVRVRFERWQERLLDLSMRNRLLNFNPDAKTAVALHVPDVPTFEDMLAVGTRFSVLPWPENVDLPGRSAPLLVRRGLVAQADAQLRQALADGLLISGLGGPALLKTLKGIERQARSDYEEGGAHTLYMAVGLLAYYETASAAQPRFAPLMLYPVQLTFERNRQLFSLRWTGDDPLPNVTLIEKLKRDFSLDISALAYLDVDDAGLDIPKLFNQVRDGIRPQGRWEVLEQAHLGLFSFSKFLMWKDLQDNRDVLLQNEVVKHLASRDTLAFRQAIDAIAPEDLDSSKSSGELPCVVDCDSTQLAAVASALAGRSFVLQGPPGTGKSQTITNLIAALLAAGKRVLFVSEKMAALDVVHRRLSDVGLSDFVLELHNPDTDKKKALTSLKSVYQRATRLGDLPWTARAQELDGMRDRLNQLADALHRPRAIGQSFHQILGRYIALSDAPEIRLTLSAPATLTAERFRELCQLAADFSERASAVEPVAAHPWAETAPGPWSAREQEALAEALGEAADTARRFESADRALSAALGLAWPSTLAATEAAARLAVALGHGPVPTEAFGGAWQEQAKRIEAYVAAREQHAITLATLAERWHPEFMEADATPVRDRFRAAQTQPAWLRLFTLFGERKRLRGFARTRPVDDAAILADAETLVACQQEARRLAEEERAVRTLLGDVASADMDAQALMALVERALTVAQACAGLTAQGVGGLSAQGLRLNGLAPKQRQALVRLGHEALESAQALRLAEAELVQRLGLRPGQCWPMGEQEGFLAGFRQRVGHFQSELPRFRSWCFYRQSAQALDSNELGAVVEAHRDGRLSAADASHAVERGILHRVLVALRDAEPALAAFDGGEHERTIERFRGLDREFRELSRRYVIACLEKNLPHPQAEPLESSEPGILLREAGRSRKVMPLRKLFQTIPQLTARLKPCFMMSPLSIARYLPADGQRFDVVIFDEASQLAPHDAIGAIARGNQVIIVGDSKQLPPTSFFQRKVEDDDVPDENDIVETESVLDEALARQMPQQMLGWHYRSKHDALIDFSNRHYYEGKLMIFPAARRFVENLGLKWHPVPDGAYMNAKAGALASTNPVEARALVDHLVAALRRTAPGTRTFGVVTFSMAQQQLISEYLDEARACFPEIEPHFPAEKPKEGQPEKESETVFVKNLENVQGDERDEIYFSICYAPDDEDKMRMNFGPLSLTGGERRLNVAVTRARCTLRVFSTLTHHRIDPERARAVGARHLKQFLEMVAAQGGDGALEQARLRVPGHGLASSIKDFLVAQGLEVHAQVGCGDYRIELAVAHPSRPGEYVLGIETDGEHYGSAPTARDRDRIRQDVLRLQGWRLLRIWGLDWWSDREGQQTRLLAAVRDAIEQADTAPEETPPPAPAPVAETIEVFAAAPAARPEPPVLAYQVARLSNLGSADDLYAPSRTNTLRQAISEVVRVEAPVHAELLCRRLMGAYGLSRLTDNVRNRVLGEAAALTQAGQLRRDGEFYSLVSGSATPLLHFRSGERDPEHWPDGELALALGWVLKHSLSIPREAALKEVARLFGFKRTGRQVASAVERGVALMVKQGRCREDDGMLHWVDG